MGDFCRKKLKNNPQNPVESLDEKELKENIALNNNYDVLAQNYSWGNVKYFRVITDNLTVYDNRSGSLKPIGKLKKGQVYPRIKDYGNWHQIQFGNIYGYVKKADTVPADGKEIKNENKSYKNQARTFKALTDVIVYDNTSGSLVPFGVIDKGQVYPIATDYGNWWRVIYADRVGYVRKSEVETQFTKSDKYFRAEKNLPIYDNRTGTLIKVGEIEKGQVYPRVKDYGNWHQIQFGNIYGYVHKNGTSPATGNEIKNLNTNYKNQSRTFKTLQTVTVYDNTSGKLVPFGKIEKGFTEFSIATDYGNWWRIIYVDRIGYVQKDSVQVEVKSTDKYFRAFKNLPVYDNRTGNLVKIGEILEGQTYPIVSDYGNWWRVQFSDHFGYVKKADTGYATDRELQNLNTNYQNTRSYFHTKHTVEVYDNTSGKLILFGKIEKGVKCHIASDYGNWWRIVYLDRVGYVRKSEVDATLLPLVKIFIDPGHGGNDSGATNGKTYEKDLNLDIAKRIVKYLNQYSGIEIKMSRTDDRYLSLDARTKMANDWGAAYYVSVHINAGGGTGFESYIFNNPTKDEINKQAIIHDHIATNIKSDGVRDRGKKQANFHVLRESNMSAILFEYLFIDNPNDLKMLQSESFRDKLARLTAEGIAKAFNLTKK